MYSRRGQAQPWPVYFKSEMRAGHFLAEHSDIKLWLSRVRPEQANRNWLTGNQIKVELLSGDRITIRLLHFSTLFPVTPPHYVIKIHQHSLPSADQYTSHLACCNNSAECFYLHICIEENSFLYRNIPLGAQAGQCPVPTSLTYSTLEFALLLAEEHWLSLHPPSATSLFATPN